MRKSALLVAVTFAAVSPTLALAKSKHVKHHVVHHRAVVAKASVPAANYQDPNGAFFRALSDLANSLGKVAPPPKGKGGAGGGGE